MMAVEHAETPRRQHQQSGAREQDTHQCDRQLALVAPLNPGAITAISQGVAHTPRATRIATPSASSAPTPHASVSAVSVVALA